MNSGEVPAEFLHPCARPVSERGRAMVRDRHVFVACFCCVFLLRVFVGFFLRLFLLRVLRVSCKSRTKTRFVQETACIFGTANDRF